MGNYLSRDEILAARQNLKTEDVKIWGGLIRVRELTGTELDAYQASMMEPGVGGGMVPAMGNMRAKLVVRSIINPDDGTLMFNDLDSGMLGQEPGQDLNRLYEVAARLSGITASSEDEATANLDDLSEGST